MAERVILLDILESHLDKPPGSAAYEFADINAGHMPPGDHQLIGTVGDVPVYLADPCVDLDDMPIDNERGYSKGSVSLWDGKYSGIQWSSNGAEFDGFEANDLGRFIEQNHARILDKNTLDPSECINVPVAKLEQSAPAPALEFDLNKTI